MLFNSFEFLFIFLPLSFLTYFLVSRYWNSARLPTLLLLSFVFYSYWDWRFAPLLAGSILLNWLVAVAFARTGVSALVIGAIILDLSLLGLFKYFNFFIDLMPSSGLPHLALGLPLGISFFTFHHIMYLTDLRRGKAPRYDLLRYALYIAFFPQVLSGPLVRWREIMHQFEQSPFASGSLERCIRASVLLILGLCEKTLLGDGLASFTSPILKRAKRW